MTEPQSEKKPYEKPKVMTESEILTELLDALELATQRARMLLTIKGMRGRHEGRGLPEGS